MTRRQTYFLPDDRQICRRVFAQPRSSPRFSCLDDASRLDPFLQGESTSDNSNHIAGNALRQSTKHRCFLSSNICVLFFKGKLDFRVTTRNDRPRFAKPEPKLSKHSLTLPDTKVDVEAFLDIRTQRLAIPNTRSKTHILRRESKNRIDFLDLFFTESSRAPTFFFIDQALKAALAVTVNPVSNRSFGVPEQFGDIGAGKILGRQEYRMKPVVVACIIISTYFILPYQRRRRIVYSYCHAYSIHYAVLYR